MGRRSARVVVMVVPLVAALCAGRGGAFAAPSLSSPTRCWIPSFNPTSRADELSLSGSGFDPNVPVQINYPPEDEIEPFLVQSTSNGDFTTELADGPPEIQAMIPPVRVRVFATYPNQSATLATLSIPLTRQGVRYRVTYHPPDDFVHGNTATGFDFAGFPDDTIYAHFAYSSNETVPLRAYRYQRTVRLGRTSGACSTLRIRRALFRSVGIRAGWWWLQFDRSPRYHPDRNSDAAECFVAFAPLKPNPYPSEPADVAEGTRLSARRARITQVPCSVVSQ
jgi:hypothetical protein